MPVGEDHALRYSGGRNTYCRLQAYSHSFIDGFPLISGTGHGHTILSGLPIGECANTGTYSGTARAWRGAGSSTGFELRRRDNSYRGVVGAVQLLNIAVEYGMF